MELLDRSNLFVINPVIYTEASFGFDTIESLAEVYMPIFENQQIRDLFPPGPVRRQQRTRQVVPDGE